MVGISLDNIKSEDGCCQTLSKSRAYDDGNPEDADGSEVKN